MRVRLNLKPGMGGTKKELAEYGDKLVCVRYRYDPAHGKRYKTVEIIVDEIEWTPRGQEVDPDTPVLVQVNWGENEIARALRKGGGVWDSRRKLWWTLYERVRELGLLDRIVWEQ